MQRQIIIIYTFIGFKLKLCKAFIENWRISKKKVSTLEIDIWLLHFVQNLNESKELINKNQTFLLHFIRLKVVV
jgi:hypothetical protein